MASETLIKALVAAVNAVDFEEERSFEIILKLIGVTAEEHRAAFNLMGRLKQLPGEQQQQLMLTVLRWAKRTNKPAFDFMYYN